jgi:thiol-disulfide isomerase/thioredoxin
MRVFLATSLCLLSTHLLADEPPGLPPSGVQAYHEYLQAQNHRAFVVAPGGVWAWRAAADSPDQAEDGALADCRANTRQKCVLYASDEQKTFDARRWPSLWGPYASAAEASRAKGGLALGQAFPDLAYRDGQGRPGQIGKLKGKVVVVHFWGSWCPPCRKEMPELAQLRKKLADRRDVYFLFLQMREPYATASQWVKQQGLDIELADSESRGEDDEYLHLADHSLLADRQIARSFPTTYVLDKRGLVVFSRLGPLYDWAGYEAFLRHAAVNSGK